MYKTIRHGENSLQYTILPQNDDFRIEGKLTSAESAYNGKKSKAKRPKRRSCCAYLGLMFVCTVIVGAILIPFLVSAECLPSPTDWFLKTKAAFTKTERPIDKNAGEHTAQSQVRNTDDKSNGYDRNIMDRIGKPVEIINTNGIEKIILKVNKTTPQENYAQTTYKNDEIVNQNQNQNLNMNSINKNDQSGNVAEKKNQTQINVATDADAELQHIGENIIQNTLMNTENEINTDRQSVNTETENMVTEIRFETVDNIVGGKQLPAITPPTIEITTVRSTTTTKTTTKTTSNQISNDFITKLRPSSPLPNTNDVTLNNAINSPRIPSTTLNDLNNTNIAVTPTITTRIIQVPLLKAAAKKPVMPPVLAKTHSQMAPDVNNRAPGNVNGPPVPMINVKASNTDADADADGNSKNPKDDKNLDWLASWPYLHTSTYLQWTNYKGEESTLLTLVVGFFILGTIISVTAILVARYKRSNLKRNRNDIVEGGAEDNATLLTTNNQSDED